MQEGDTFRYRQVSPGELLAPYVDCFWIRRQCHEHHASLARLGSRSRSAGAKAFYAEKLGFRAVRELAAGEQQWVELAPNGAGTTITLVTWLPQMPPGSLQGLVFDTDDIARACEELKARGVAVSPIESDPWGQYARFSDPDGNGLVLRQKAPAA